MLLAQRKDWIVPGKNPSSWACILNWAVMTEEHVAHSLLSPSLWLQEERIGEKGEAGVPCWNGSIIGAVCLESKRVELHLVSENCKQGHSETSKLDCSMGRKKGLLGIKLQRLSLRGQREEQNGRKASRFSVAAGWVLWADAGYSEWPGTRCFSSKQRPTFRLVYPITFLQFTQLKFFCYGHCHQHWHWEEKWGWALDLTVTNM